MGQCRRIQRIADAADPHHRPGGKESGVDPGMGSGRDQQRRTQCRKKRPVAGEGALLRQQCEGQADHEQSEQRACQTESPERSGVMQHHIGQGSPTISSQKRDRGRIERGDCILMDGRYVDRERNQCNEHCRHDEAQASPPEQAQDDRPDDVELFLDGQRPQAEATASSRRRRRNSRTRSRAQGWKRSRRPPPIAFQAVRTRRAEGRTNPRRMSPRRRSPAQERCAGFCAGRSPGG